MKKSFTRTVCLALAAACAAIPLAACGGPKDDPNTLNIICLDKGYGTEWINTIAEKYKADTGMNVNISVSTNSIGANIESKNNTDDLYISVGTAWKQYAAAGKFARLDDLLDDTVDGKKVKDLVLTDYAQSIYFPDRDGELHTYRLPWTAGVGGIYYNTVMFEENGWDIPETYDELIELCSDIVNDAVPVKNTTERATVKPFVYTSGNIDYFDYAVFTWWAQLAGKDAITEFTKYSSPDNFDTAKNTTYAKLKQATELWNGIFGESDYFIGYDNNHTAQTRFANGYAAMMFNGDWLYNEILGYEIPDLDSSFKLGFMKTPTAPDAVDTDVIYTVGEDQYIAIPASSTKADKAKDFIKLIISDYGCGVFANRAHGILAYSGSLKETATNDTFMKDLIKKKSEYTEAFTSFPPVTVISDITKQNAMINLTDKVDIWGSGATRPYDVIIKGTTVDAAFNTIKKNVEDNWEQWRRVSVKQ